MYNLSEKDIDYIFQEGSKAHEVPFKESAWDNMEVLLDKQDRTRKYAYLSFLLLGIAFSGMIAFYTLNNSNKGTIKKQNTPAKRHLEIATTQSNLPTETAEFPSNEKNIILNNKNLAVNKNTPKAANASSISNKLVSSASNKLVPKPKYTTSQIVENSIATTTVIHAPRNTQPILLEIATKPVISTSSSPNKYTKADEMAMRAASNKNEMIGTNLPIVSTLDLAKINKLTYKSDIEFNREINITKAKTNRFRVGLIVGKEWSTVGMDASKLGDGFRLGLELSYLFGKKFQLGTGAIFSKKSYQTEGSNFTPRPQSRLGNGWVDGVAPEIVTGQCDVIEIPLEFSYYFKGFNRNSFYASAGVSTYFMTDELYDFTFSDPEQIQDPNVPKQATTRGQDKCIHYFGIANIAFGYQKYINPNTAIQIGPYIEIPLTGIGMGQVDLVTTGIQVKLSFSK